MPMATGESAIAAVGDVHGHLQLALCVLARWQDELKVHLEAVLLCGDVGTFTDPSQLDSATRGRGKENPCELEFLEQWSRKPSPQWLDRIFAPKDQGGLGLVCPVVMVHGNHEGFAHLERIVPRGFPDGPVDLLDLPGVDARSRIRLLPSGWRASAPSGLTIAGVGGIEREQREREYHPMATIDEEAVLEQCGKGPVDILITHEGSSAVQGEEKGSKTLQVLLDERIPRLWFHGHSCPHGEPVRTGRTTVIPLGGIPFDDDGKPGTDGWAVARIGPGEPEVLRGPPPFLREFHRRRWTKTRDGLHVCPPLARFAWPS